MDDQKTARPSRRSGGRNARKMMRAAPLAADMRPVRPGMTGGQYKPLTEAEVVRIHEAAVQILEEIGLSLAPESGVKAMRAYGAVYSPKDERIRFPRTIIDKALKDANRQMTLFARDPKHDLTLSGTRVHYGTAGAAVHLANLQTGEYEESTLEHLFQAAKIVDHLDNVHFFQRCLIARDITDNRAMDLNTLYASIVGTTKHIGTAFTEDAFAHDCIDMLHMVAGGEAAWRARPFVLNSNCFVVPPLKFATESCEVMETCIKAGMPVLLLSAGQAGATAPAPLAGALAQAVAECLAGLVYVQAIQPGAPAVFGTWPFVADLRSGAMCSGSAEQAILTAACAQMGQHYDLPTGAPGGMADAKFPDAQAGSEHGIGNVTAGLAGLNMVYEAAGMYGSLLGFSLEGLIIDNDVLGQCLRTVRGLEVSDENLDIERIKSVCLEGPGHYLSEAQTLAKMQTEYFYPELSDRLSPKEWAEVGKPELIAAAVKKKDQILAGRTSAALSPELDQRIRETFPIYLPKELL
ncbi:trimethylamine methyltransferase family protein [Cognatishimia sp. WU-CL00825]|uniref:trimethylamine methyltransferase family protein n=1 Tax=Cognatishimia sp. WU-CL00825 TaxID=3127658 RepID=UPI003105BB70